MHLNIEFKARYSNLDYLREILLKAGAEYRGRDHQIDVYFNVARGRLKLRKGNIENSLIAYEREDSLEAKQSQVHLLQVGLEQKDVLEGILITTLGVKVVVDKQRDIYFIKNVKFHVDDVERLGSFVEVEAIDFNGDIGGKRLQQQCAKYKRLLGIKNEDLVAKSYSDLLLELQLKV